jgi:kinesin family protein 11
MTKLVEGRLQKFQDEQQLLIEQIQHRMRDFMEKERASETQTRFALLEKAENFERSHKQIVNQTAQSKEELNHVLNEITDLREDVKNKVGEGLKDLGKAGERISAGIMSEIEEFGTHLHTSYASLGRDFKAMFDDLTKEVVEQREEIESLKRQMSEESTRLTKETTESANDFESLLKSEKAAREQENRDLMAQIQAIVAAKAQQQELRMQELTKLPPRLRSTAATHSIVASAFADSNDMLIQRSMAFSGRIVASRDAIKAKVQNDFAVSYYSYSIVSKSNINRPQLHTPKHCEQSPLPSTTRQLVSLKSR